VTLSEFEGQFCDLKPFNTYNSYINCNSTTICLHINEKVHMACNFSFIVKNEGVFKVTVSNVHFKSGSISGREIDRDIVTTGH